MWYGKTQLAVIEIALADAKAKRRQGWHKVFSPAEVSFKLGALIGWTFLSARVFKTSRLDSFDFLRLPPGLWRSLWRKTLEPRTTPLP